MSQNENDGFAQFTATGGELNVPFDFKIADRAEIKIIRTRSGVETTLVLNTDYTIADNQLNQDLGGVAVLIGSATPALASDVYTALLNTPYSRGVLDGSSDFNQSGDFFAATLNKQFDFVIRMINRLARDTGKSLKFSETLNIPTATITGLVGTGKALIGGSVSGTFEEGPDASQIASAQGYASSAATSASNAATSETNAQSWATAAQSAATGINWTKARAASTANINIASPGAAIDSVTLVSGDRVLLKNQSTASQNGIYVWSGAAVAMTRATDMDTWAEVVSKVIQIEEGTVNADLPYMATVNTGGTLGSTAITFTLFQAPLQDGAVSTAAKVVDGILTYVKIAASSIANLSELVAGTASKLVDAATFKSYMDTYIFAKGQTWQDVAASRAIGTTYTNNTGRPIMVNASFTFTDDGINLEVGGVVACSCDTGSGTGVLRLPMSVVVPDGSTYRAVAARNAATINTWAELR